MSAILLSKAIDGGEEGVKNFLSYFPRQLVESFVSGLDPTLRQRLTEIEEGLNTICHNPKDPYYDLSLLKIGDRVIHRRTGKKGIVAIESGGILGQSFVVVSYEDGTEGTVYPNQIKKSK